MDASTGTRADEVRPSFSEPEPTTTWRGRVDPFSVGDPGRAAARTVPIPDEAAWDRRDTVLDGVALFDGARKRVGEVRAASVRGLAHRAYGTVRQDEYSFRRTPDGRYLVLAVADGVSSGKHSHRAAIIAARRGTEVLARLLASTGPAALRWADFIRHVANGVEQRGRHLLAGQGVPDVEGVPVREIADLLATTVLYAVVDLAPVGGAHEVHVVSVGDSSAWVLRAGGRWEPQHAVKNDGAVLHSSSVHALPLLSGTEPAPARTTVAPGEALVLMSDGIGDPLADGTGDVGRFLTGVWSTPPASGLEFAAQVGFARRSFDDDRTAVAFWPVTTA
jgi:serine/threonine protein phosphatase PrpC